MISKHQHRLFQSTMTILLMRECNSGRSCIKWKWFTQQQHIISRWLDFHQKSKFVTSCLRFAIVGIDAMLDCWIFCILWSISRQWNILACQLDNASGCGVITFEVFAIAWDVMMFMCFSASLLLLTGQLSVTWGINSKRGLSWKKMIRQWSYHTKLFVWL